MTKRILPTPEELRQLLRYEPETGKLFWKIRDRSLFKNDRLCNSWNSRFSGKEAFTATKDSGHYHGYIHNRLYLAHRVIWAIYYGEWPENDIDHANLNPADNRISNLRIANKSKNGINRKIQHNNTSGYKGVTRHGRKWLARIGIGGTRKNLGFFETPEMAHAAYCEAAKKYHGEFARFE